MANEFQEKGLAVLESYPYLIFINSIVVISLFGDDIRQAALPPATDLPFTYFTLSMIIIFAIDIILNAIFQPRYFASFYFVLDIIATGMMSLDLIWVANLISKWTNVANASQVSRAARAVRVGSRICRLIRIIRLMRIMQLYRKAQQAVRKTEQRKADMRGSLIEMKKTRLIAPRRHTRRSHTLISNTGIKKKLSKSIEPPELKENEQMTIQETETGQIINESTQKSIVILVVLAILMVPLLQVNSYFSWPSDRRQILIAANYFNSTRNLHQTSLCLQTFILQKESSYNAVIDIEFSYNETNNISFPGPLINATLDPRYENIRETAKGQLFQNQASMIYSLIHTQRWMAIFNIIKTLLTCIVLILGAYFSSLDIDGLVIEPLEGMISTVRAISQNPLIAEKLLNIKQFKRRSQLQDLDLDQIRKKAAEQTDKDHYETNKLQQLVLKIGVMLKVGFGEAGADIITSNLKDNGNINPMIPGKKVYGIFGFIDIRGFSEITEVLQSEVMKFVNCVGEIIHRNVEDWGGSPNKNIGEAFLLVWRLNPPEGKEYNEEYFNSTEVRQTADLALYSYLKIISEIKCTISLKSYRQNKKLCQKFGRFEVDMGYGLHFGWAIEGAIGSDHKIDASYLSPNVNIASRLEAASRQYGVNILVSDSFANLLSTPIRLKLRELDKIIVKGSNQPISVFTIDLKTSLLPINKLYRDDKDSMTRISQRNHYEKMIKTDQYSAKIFAEDLELSLMRMDMEDFMERWVEGYDCYIKGNWGEACRIFAETKVMLQFQDGPSQTLLQFMTNNKNLQWKGYRALNQK